MTIGSSVRRVAGVMVTGVFVAALLPLAGPARAADNGAWSVGPTKQGNFTPRQYFFIEAASGQTIKDSITIANGTEDVLNLALYPADAFNVESGAGFGLRERPGTGEKSKNVDVGTWINLAKSSVSVPPKSKTSDGRATVGFTLTVPRGTTPGDHAGGIVTIEPPPTPSQGQASVVGIQRAIGVRVYVRVAGPLTPALSVEQVSLKVVPARLPFIGKQGGATVTYRVRNSGNTRITADRVITLKGFLGRTLHDTGEGPIPEILPGSTVTLTESFAGMPVLDQVNARVVLTEKEQGVETAGDASAWSVSWVFLFLLLLVGVGVGLAIWWSRRDPSVVQPDMPADDEQVAAL